VKMSNRRRATYYTSKDKIPKKFQDPTFGYDRKGRLCTNDGQPIIRNARSVNTPRMKKINGQDFYAGNTRPVMRVKVVNAIKDAFRPYLRKVRKIPKDKFPIQISCAMYDVAGKADSDLDNKWIYLKVFQDLIVNEKLIPDDNIKYVSKAASMEFFPVETTEERKLVFTITSDTREHTLFYV
jgi:hypothetical protein